jgi:hypothetical protein
MPKDYLEKDGLRIEIRDRVRWRRIVPFYTDYFKTSFDVVIERYDPESPPDRRYLGSVLWLSVLFSDERAAYVLEAPTEQFPRVVGEKLVLSTKNILVAPPGQTKIIYGNPSNHDILFSYFVRSESSIMASAFGLFVAGMILVGSLGGAIINAQCQPSPVNVVGPVAVVTATTEPTETATPIPPTPRPTQ